MPITDGRIQRSKYIGRSRVVTEVEAKRVYERLRKRSYRFSKQHYPLPDVWHNAYVAGVRDALKELL
jgi:hypothetical protein